MLLELATKLPSGPALSSACWMKVRICSFCRETDDFKLRPTGFLRIKDSFNTVRVWNELSSAFADVSELIQQAFPPFSLRLTALVESVQPGDVILAHLCGLAEGHIAVWDGLHGGEVVLGEGVPEEWWDHRESRSTKIIRNHRLLTHQPLDSISVSLA